MEKVRITNLEIGDVVRYTGETVNNVYPMVNNFPYWIVELIKDGVVSTLVRMPADYLVIVNR